LMRFLHKNPKIAFKGAGVRSPSPFQGEVG